MFICAIWTITTVLRISALIVIQGLVQSQNHLHSNIQILHASAFTVQSISNPSNILHLSSTNFKSGSNIQDSMIRPPSIHDLPDMKRIIDAAELFPSEMLDEMTKNYFDQQQIEKNGNMTNDVSNTVDTTNGSKEYWFVKVVTEEVEDLKQSPKDIVVALLYAGPEKMTEGCYNVFLLAVHPHYHRRGYGRELMTYAEDQLKQNQNARIVLVETSGNDEFHTSREFYTELGYNAVAQIPEFYQAGEDKIIFHKFML
jgi:ribosomal protein S18 acetylase RimI-like enzyme